MTARIIRLDACALTDFDGIGIADLVTAHMRKENCSVEAAVDMALTDVLIDLSRRVEAARKGGVHD